MAGAGDVNADGFSDLVIGPGGYLFLGGPTGTSMTPIVLTDPAMGNVNSPVPTHNLDGRSAGVGDLNGDGFDDVIVGEPLASGGAGAAYIFLGNAGSISTTPDLTLSPPDPSLGNYGYALARSL